MTRANQTFRDFGILPGQVPPPAGRVRAYYSAARVAGQYVGTGIVAVVSLGLAILFAWLLPFPLNVLACAAALWAAARSCGSRPATTTAGSSSTGRRLRPPPLHRPRRRANHRRRRGPRDDGHPRQERRRPRRRRPARPHQGDRGAFPRPAHAAARHARRPRDDQRRGADRGDRLPHVRARRARRRCHQPRRPAARPADLLEGQSARRSQGQRRAPRRDLLHADRRPVRHVPRLHGRGAARAAPDHVGPAAGTDAPRR